MTVAAGNRRIAYTGTGANTVLAVSFPFFTSADLAVIKRVTATGVETILTIGVHYSVSVPADPPGTGTVTPIDGATDFPSSVTWTIVRTTERSQTVDYVENDAFPAESHEDALDKVTLIAQEVDDATLRSLRFPESDSSSIDGTLPNSVDRASRYLKFSASGAPTAVTTVDPGSVTISAFAETVLDDANPSAARATLGVSIGSNVQAWDADLDSISALAKTDGNAILGNGSAWTSVSLLPLLRGWIAGFEMSRTSATVLSIASGGAISEDSARKPLRTTGAETIDLTLASVPGGLGVARATNTWYRVFAIYKDSDGSTDFYADTSATAANKPAGYSSYRRVGSFRTNATGSGELIDFVQNGDEFLWKDPPLDVSAPAGTNPGTSAITRTLTVPIGIKMNAILNAHVTEPSDTHLYLSSLDVNDEAASASAAPLATIGADNVTAGQSFIRTNTSAQIRSRLSTSTANTELYISTLGWIDPRGKDL